jgi:mercuric ion transport protein
MATLGAITGLGAIAGSSCCVLPLVLAGLGAGGAAFGGLEFLAAYQPYIFGAAVLLLAGAWFASWRRSRTVTCKAEGACARPKTQDRTMIALGIATLFVALAAGWSLIEPVLLQAIQ